VKKARTERKSVITAVLLVFRLFLILPDTRHGPDLISIRQTSWLKVWISQRYCFLSVEVLKKDKNAIYPTNQKLSVPGHLCRYIPIKMFPRLPPAFRHTAGFCQAKSGLGISRPQVPQRKHGISNVAGWLNCRLRLLISKMFFLNHLKTELFSGCLYRDRFLFSWTPDSDALEQHQDHSITTCRHCHNGIIIRALIDVACQLWTLLVVTCLFILILLP